MRTRDTCTRGTPGMMDIVAGTDTETTGLADDMFGRMGVRHGRRVDGRMAAGMGGRATGTGSEGLAARASLNFRRTMR